MSDDDVRFGDDDGDDDTYTADDDDEKTDGRDVPDVDP